MPKSNDTLFLEDVLVRHPRLRLYAMRGGWRNADRMIALLYAHPQVCLDTGVIDYTQPTAEFHPFLKRLVDARSADRMFGPDQAVWPGAINRASDAINSADFLTPKQKRGILHDNAARFMRLREPADKA